MISPERIQSGKRIVRRGYVEIYSEPLNLTFRCPVNDPRASRLEMIVSNHEYLLALNPKRR